MTISVLALPERKPVTLPVISDTVVPSIETTCLPAFSPHFAAAVWGQTFLISTCRVVHRSKCSQLDMLHAGVVSTALNYDKPWARDGCRETAGSLRTVFYIARTDGNLGYKTECITYIPDLFPSN